MALWIDDRFIVRTSPQALTDILVQVAKPAKETGEDGQTLFTFQIGDFFREMIEGFGTLDGRLSLDNDQMTTFARWADQLEITAAMIRVALKSRITA